MTERYEIKSWRQGKDKPYPHKIGYTYQNKAGQTVLVFDSLPLPDKDGRVTAFLDVPRDRAAPRDTPAKSAPKRDLDDEIPF